MWRSGPPREYWSRSNPRSSKIVEAPRRDGKASMLSKDFNREACSARTKQGLFLPVDKSSIIMSELHVVDTCWSAQRQFVPRQCERPATTSCKQWHGVQCSKTPRQLEEDSRTDELPYSDLPPIKRPCLSTEFHNCSSKHDVPSDRLDESRKTIAKAHYCWRKQGVRQLRVFNSNDDSASPQ